MITRKEALALMRSFVGKSRSKLPWLRKRQGLGDCAAGYSYCATGKVQKYIWVSELVGLMKKNGTWRKGSPQPGDAVIYDWNGDGGCDHVAMFHSKNKAGQWIAFGANQGKTKMVSKLVTGRGVILGWGRPFTFTSEHEVAPLLDNEVATSRHEMSLQPEHYELPEVKVVPSVVVRVPVLDGILKEGSVGSSVNVLQRKLGIAVDGDFGPSTRKAVVAFQVKHDLTADGLVGPKTWKVLHEF